MPLEDDATPDGQAPFEAVVDLGLTDDLLNQSGQLLDRVKSLPFAGGPRIPDSLTMDGSGYPAWYPDISSGEVGGSPAPSASPTDSGAAPADQAIPVRPVQQADLHPTTSVITSSPDQAARTAEADQAFIDSYLHGDIGAALHRYGEIRFKYADGKVLVDNIVDNKQIPGSDTSVIPQDMLSSDARGGHLHGAGSRGTMAASQSVDQQPGAHDWEYPKATGVAYYADTYGLARLNYDDDKGFSYDILATPKGTGAYQNKSKMDGVIGGWNGSLKAGTLVPAAAQRPH